MLFFGIKIRMRINVREMTKTRVLIKKKSMPVSSGHIDYYRIISPNSP